MYWDFSTPSSSVTNAALAAFAAARASTAMRSHEIHKWEVMTMVKPIASLFSSATPSTRTWARTVLGRATTGSEGWFMFVRLGGVHLATVHNAEQEFCTTCPVRDVRPRSEVRGLSGPGEDAICGRAGRGGPRRRGFAEVAGNACHHGSMAKQRPAPRSAPDVWWEGLRSGRGRMDAE